jgi:RPA family protein
MFRIENVQIIRRKMFRIWRKNGFQNKSAKIKGENENFKTKKRRKKSRKRKNTKKQKKKKPKKSFETRKSEKQNRKDLEVFQNPTKKTASDGRYV